MTGLLLALYCVGLQERAREGDAESGGGPSGEHAYSEQRTHYLSTNLSTYESIDW